MLCFSLASCLSGCPHLIAASWQHLSWGLVLQVEMLVKLLTGLLCWQLHRGNGFVLFLRVPKWPELLAALTKLVVSAGL